MSKPAGGRRTHRGGKKEAILAAARRLFLENGFASTSVDAVTEAAGVSKPTVYAHYPTKEALLEAVVRTESEGAEVPNLLRATGDPRLDLERAAHALLALALAPDALAWDRMMAGESRRQPALGRLFWDCGPRRILDVLAGFFRELSATGTVHVPDPDHAADFFFGMVVGVPLLAAQLTGIATPSGASAARCREVADRFLWAYAPAAKPRKR